MGVAFWGSEPLPPPARGLGLWGSDVSSASGVRSAVPAENEFGAFLASRNILAARKANIFNAKLTFTNNMGAVFIV